MALIHEMGPLVPFSPFGKNIDEVVQAILNGWAVHHDFKTTFNYAPKTLVPNLDQLRILVAAVAILPKYDNPYINNAMSWGKLGLAFCTFTGSAKRWSEAFETRDSSEIDALHSVTYGGANLGSDGASWNVGHASKTLVQEGVGSYEDLYGRDCIDFAAWPTGTIIRELTVTYSNNTGAAVTPPGFTGTLYGLINALPSAISRGN